MNNGGISPDSARVETITNDGETLTYAYDDRGYILSVTKDANNYSEYRYDALGQLMRENYSWGYVSYTTVYAYDVGGNITSKTKYDFVAGDGQVGAPIDTIPYIYGATWKDKLASYDGVNISYDDIGNPLDDGTWDYTWTQGRKLEQITDGITTASYKYNSSGIRTEKTVGGTTTVYNLAGSNITWQKTGAGTPIYFIYDSGGKLWGLKYTDGNTYFYVRNAQGDIIKIVNGSGAVVVEYTYDAWGKLISTSGTMASTLGVDNPFRYRGYYYDSESGLYYLNARYYNPQWARFINADSYGGATGDLLGHNIFAYCSNNPVMKSDPSGNRPDEELDRVVFIRLPSTSRFVRPNPGDPEKGQLNGRYGYWDKFKNLWSWHKEENHWDVQRNNGGGDYTSISDDGRILKVHGKLPRLGSSKNMMSDWGKIFAASGHVPRTSSNYNPSEYELVGGCYVLKEGLYFGGIPFIPIPDAPMVVPQLPQVQFPQWVPIPMLP